MPDELELVDLLPTVDERPDPEPPAPVEDPAKTAAADEFARLKAMADRLRPLQDVADELDADPSKIYAVRAALQGRGPQPAVAPPQPLPTLSADQLAQLDEQFRERPAQLTAQAAQLAARQELDAFYRSVVEPLREASGESLIDNYKAQKAGDPLFKQISAQFDKEIADLDRKALLGAPLAERRRQLDLRYRAATATVLKQAMDESAAKQRDTAPTLGSGGGSAPSKSRSKLAQNPDLVRLALATGAISKEDLEDIASVASDLQD